MGKQIPIVIAVIQNKAGELLLARRIDKEIPDANGTWEFVGGKINFGETPEKAVMREVKEETGLNVEVLRLLPKAEMSMWTKADGEEIQTIILCYQCKIVGGKLHTENFDPKIAELKYIATVELQNYKIMKNGMKIVSMLESNG